MTNDQAVNKVRGELQTLGPAVQNLQAETLAFGQLPDETQKAHGAVAQCVANGAAGLIQRAYRQAGLPPLPNPFEEMFGMVPSDQPAVTAASDVSEANLRAANLNYVLALEAYNYAQGYAEKMERASEVGLSMDNVAERQTALEARQTALAARADALVQRVQVLSTSNSSGIEVASQLIDSARYMLGGSREDLEAARGKMPSTADGKSNSESLKEDPELARLAELNPDAFAAIEAMATSMVTNMANAMLGLGSVGTSIGCLLAGEKEADVCESALQIAEQELAAVENPQS